MTRPPPISVAEYFRLKRELQRTVDIITTIPHPPGQLLWGVRVANLGETFMVALPVSLPAAEAQERAVVEILAEIAARMTAMRTARAPLGAAN